MKYFHNLLKNIINQTPHSDYLQEKITRIASDEQHRKSTLLMNLMFPRHHDPSFKDNTLHYCH